MDTKEFHKLDKQIGLIGTNQNAGDKQLMLRLKELHLQEFCNKIFTFMANRYV